MATLIVICFYVLSILENVTEIRGWYCEWRRRLRGKVVILIIFMLPIINTHFIPHMRGVVLRKVIRISAGQSSRVIVVRSVRRVPVCYTSRYLPGVQDPQLSTFYAIIEQIIRAVVLRKVNSIGDEHISRIIVEKRDHRGRLAIQVGIIESSFEARNFVLFNNRTKI